MNNKITRYILALSKIKGVGPAFIKKRLTIFQKYSNDINSFKIAFSKSLSEKEEKKIDIEYYLDEANILLEECKKENIVVIDISNILYPKNLLELTDPPPILYAKGNLNLLDKKIIGIIGTRKATNLGETIASRVGGFFSKDFAIINGLVDGIDKSAISNKNNIYSNVIGILSGGLNFNYTSSKITKDLAEKVLNNNGLLLSESQPNQKEDSFSGSKSSRIQAGLSDSLILIQSSIDGGSKYTLNSFKNLNRPLGIINFSNNKYFNIDESFSANRLLLKEEKIGLSFICEKINDKNIELDNLKYIDKINITKIVRIQNKEDYLVLVNLVNRKSKLF